MTAVRDATAGADEVVVLAPIGGREAPGDWRDPSHSGPVHGEPRSLAEQVGRHLLALADCTLPVTCVEVPGLVAAPQDANVALLVLGDGAAARRDGAPGYIDERSFAYDDHLAALLGDGDGTGLTRSTRSSARAPGHRPAQLPGPRQPDAAGRCRAALARRPPGPDLLRRALARGDQQGLADRATMPRSSYAVEVAMPTLVEVSVVSASRQTRSPTGSRSTTTERSVLMNSHSAGSRAAEMPDAESMQVIIIGMPTSGSPGRSGTSGRIQTVAAPPSVIEPFTQLQSTASR